MSHVSRSISRLRWALGTAIALAAATLLWRQLQSLSLVELHAAWSSTPSSDIALSVFATAISFACLAGYEWFATAQVAPGRVPASAALGIGAVAHAIANTLGFHVLTAGAVRYQAYRTFGLGVGDVTRIVALVGACVAGGVIAVSSFAIVALCMSGDAWRLTFVLVALALLVLAGLAWRAGSTKTMLASGAVRKAAALLVLGAIEMSAAIGALHVLMPASSLPGPASFVLVYVSAALIGVASHVPGGIGVFEAAMLAATPPANHADVLIALLAYRAIYNLLPFLLAVLSLLPAALRRRSRLPGPSDQFDGG